MVDLIKNKGDRREFCKQRDILFHCRTSHLNADVENCEINCPFEEEVDVQKWCNEEGITIRAALERWAVKKIDNPMKLTLLADGLGVNVGELKALIKLLKAYHDKQRNR